MMESGIYDIRNTINSKVYVGSTIDFAKRKKAHFDLLAKNRHWNIKLQRSVNKHGLENFIFEIIERCQYEKPLIVDRENFYIALLNSKIEGYNIADANFGDTRSHHPRREEINELTRNTIRSQVDSMTEEERKAKWGRPREKNGMFGKKRKLESKQKTGSGVRLYKKIFGYGANKGYIRSASVRKGDSDRAKLRVGELNSFYGKQHSEKTRKQISEKRRGKEPATLRPFYIDGVLYRKLRDAEAALGIKGSTIHHRLNSPNPKFAGYQYAEVVV